MNRNTPIRLSKAEILDALCQVLREERKAHWDAQAKAENGIKSDPFRQLERDGHLSAEFFLAEAALIMTKTSNLPAGQRAYISAVMDKAVTQELSKLATDKEEKAAKRAEAAKVSKSTTASKKPAKSNGNAEKSNGKPQK